MIRLSAVLLLVGAMMGCGVGLTDSATSSSEPRFATGLWTDVVEKSPGKLRPRLGLGLAYMKRAEWLQSQSRFEEASIAYNRAAESLRTIIAMSTPVNDPDGAYGAEGRLNLAGVLMSVNEFADAEALIQEVVAERPNYLPGIVKLAYLRLFQASVYQKQGRHPEALAAYRAALAATDRGIGVRVMDNGMLAVGALLNYRATAHAALGDCEAANLEFRGARKFDPNVPVQTCRASVAIGR